MNKIDFTKKIYITFLICLSIFILQKNYSYAEQTIINIPSSEVIPLGNIILKESSKFSPYNDDFVANITPSVTFGTGFGTEFSAGVGTTLDKSTLVRGNLAAKKVFFIGNSSRLTVGGSINPYLSQSATPDTLLYTHFSQRIKKTKTSVTAGAYLNGQKSFPNRAGFLIGLEQIIIPNKLRVAIDWISGEHSYGKMGAGIKYRPIPSLSITSAVIVPNEDPDNVGFSLSISKFISISDEDSIKRRFSWNTKKRL